MEANNSLSTDEKRMLSGAQFMDRYKEAVSVELGFRN